MQRCYSPEAMFAALGSMRLDDLEMPSTLHKPLYDRQAGVNMPRVPAQIVLAKAEAPLLFADAAPFCECSDTESGSDSDSDSGMNGSCETHADPSPQDRRGPQDRWGEAIRHKRLEVMAYTLRFVNRPLASEVCSSSS